MKLKKLLEYGKYEKGLPRDINYDLIQDMITTLPLPASSDKYIKHISKPIISKDDWPIKVEIKLTNGKNITAEKWSKWRSDWIFIMDGKKYNMSQSNQLSTQLSNMMITDDLKRLEYELKRHDWTYEMSDDFRAWNSGDSHKKQILQIYDTVKQQGKQKEAIAIWKKYALKNLKIKPFWNS